MAIKSKRGAAKRYWAIIRQCYRDAAGGTTGGFARAHPGEWEEGVHSLFQREGE